MNIAEGTPTSAFSVADVTVNAPMPFKGGHTCTEQEASVLNQVLIENCRNNLRDLVKEIKEKNPGADVTALVQAEVDKYIASYEFGVRRSGPRLDPIEAQALELAVTLVKKRAAEKGEKLSELGMPELRERARVFLDDPVLGQKFRDRAKIIVDASALDV